MSDQNNRKEEVQESVNAEVVEEKDGNNPLDYALDLVQDPGIDYMDWKKRNLGLQLSLLGLAGIQAKKVSTLLNLMQNLEERIFDDVNLAGLKPDELTKLYEVVSRSQRDSIDFVRQIISGTDWSKIESDLVAIQAKKDSEVMSGLPEHSDVILQQIVKQLNMVNPKPQQIEDKNKKDDKKDKKDKQIKTIT